MATGKDKQHPAVAPLRGTRARVDLLADRRKNVLRAVRRDGPDYIPMHFHINEACWRHYPPEMLKESMESHPFLFPDFEGTGSGRTELDYRVIERPGRPFVDGWGCRWETTLEGTAGTVTNHPLANWAAFEGYAAPDPQVDSGKGPIDWVQIARNVERARSDGQLTMGGLRHGHTFQTLVDICGYENLLFDMVDHDPRLMCLIEMVEQFNAAIVRRYLNLGVEWMCYPEDLGMQTGPMLSPDMFRAFIKPSYERLMKPARDAGCIIHMHSDGRIRDLLDDLIDGGVDVVNLQDLVNGIDWIKDKLAGRVCIDLDIDRQTVTPAGTPEQIDALIREEVTKLGSKEGGLMMIYGLYPGVPLENVKALMDAMERYTGFYA
ncbi:MAG: uroporphyrinogen decarboxylase family protein [Sedimentisphaerales bacterium]|nr:uroporphyrinogen decarboxylase family protein [Sedimentisphaerales bacterium]